MKELRQESNSLDFFSLAPLSSAVSLGCRYMELLLNQIEVWVDFVGNSLLRAYVRDWLKIGFWTEKRMS